MFSGLGLESDHRDANKRQTGRRHGAREMTSETGSPNYYTADAMNHRRTSDEHREQQVQRANAGPSFMDQMFNNEGKRNVSQQQQQQQQHGHGVNRPANAPKDHLNLFSWDTHGDASNVSQRKQQQQQGGPQQQQRQQQPVDTAETRRAAEARKFESNTGGNFLDFSNTPKDALEAHHRGKKQGNPQTHPEAPFATGDSYSGEADVHRRGKKVAPVHAAGDGVAVQGFRGMGDQCQSRPTGRKVGGHNGPTQIFPPQVDPQQQQQQQQPAQRYVAGRPPWLQYDDEAPQQQQQRSVRFDIESPSMPDGGHNSMNYNNGGGGGAPDAYYRPQDQQDPSNRRMMQYQQRSHQDNDGPDDIAYYTNNH